MGAGQARKLRERIWNRDKGLCFYCGIFLARRSSERTLDHVIPKCKDGTSNRMWNLVISCRDCNTEKGASDPTQEQLAVVLRRKTWSETYVALGKAIGLAKASGAFREATILLGLQRAIRTAMAEESN